MINRLLPWFGVLLLGSSLSSGINAIAQTKVVVEASRDNTLYENDTGAISNGAGSHFFVGKTNTGAIRRAVLAFDVSGVVSAEVTVDSVRLTLNMSRTVAGASTVSLHRILADWGEGTSDAVANEGLGIAATSGDATWLHRNFDQTLWQNAGGDFENVPSATTSIDQPGSYTWTSTPEMIADVRRWIDNPEQNFGWLLRGDEESPRTTKRFDSRENANPSVVPRLHVFYSVPPTPVLATSEIGPTNADPIAFTVDFGEAIDTATFTLGDLTLSSGAAQNLVNTGDDQHFTFEIASPTDGETLAVSIAADVLTDAGGTNNLASNTLSLAIDRTAPAAPVITQPASPTNDTTPVITGTASEDGGTITLTSDVEGVLAPTGTVTGGAWSIQMTSPLSEATHSLTATHTDAPGNTSLASTPKILVVDPSATRTESRNVPTSVQLLQNYPNPFNPQTTISYRLARTGRVRLQIYNAFGERVAVLEDGIKSAGEYDVSFDATSLSSGVYFYSLTTGDFSQTKKMVLLR